MSTTDSKAPAAVLAAVALAAATSLGVERFFQSNQNSYLLHAVGPSYASLEADWLLSTRDPFPVFTAVVRPLFAIGGEPALVALTLWNAFIAFGSLAVIACVLSRHVSRPSERLWTSALAVLMVAGAVHAVPRLPVSALRTVGPFGGLGGQYLLNSPGLVQPSDTGVLLLASVALAMVAFTASPGRTRLAAVGGVLAALACALHPTYVVPLGIGLASMALADVLLRRGLGRVSLYATTGAGAVVLVLLSNPVARGARHGPEAAQAFLSFERIPHHTLISRWPGPETLAICLLILLGALLSRRLLRSWWLGVAMTLAVVLSLVAAVLVESTRSVTLASVFPWRISVVLVPLACMIVATTAAGVLVRVLDRRVVGGLVAALGVLAVWAGAHVSKRSRAEAPSPVVELLRATSPDGVGLIPLGHQNVRLNARVPVYVDWKTHPYDRAELAEWVRRVESVRAIRSDPTRLCELVEREAIDWVVVAEGWNVACLQHWRRTEREGVRLLIRPS